MEKKQLLKKEMVMVKFITDGKERRLIGLGLSEENIKKLKEELPIFVKGENLGIRYDIAIFYGKTEKDMAEMIKPFIGKDTEIIKY